MEAMESMASRHSVRAYQDTRIEGEALKVLRAAIDDINAAAGLSMELVLDDEIAFSTILGRYGRFSGARNFIVVKGKKSRDLRIRAGYWGEKLVLKATEMGLGTCWVGGTYSKKGIGHDSGDELVCVITIGYAKAPGKPHQTKPMEKFIAGKHESPPAWFLNGVKAAMLAPTAMNQQKFAFSLSGSAVEAKVSGFGFFTDVDLGIVKYHFELGAGRDNFTWKEA